MTEPQSARRGGLGLSGIRGIMAQPSGALFRHLQTEAALSAPTKLASKDGAAPGGPVTKRSLFMRYGMLFCCIAMMLPIAGYLLSGGTFGGLLDNLALVVPLVACVGMHLVLHRLTGKSCHGGHDESDMPARPSGPGGTPGDAPSHWTDIIHTDRLAPPSPTTNVRSRGLGKGAQE